jgi:membrane-bound lytic murein transglycosylase D
MSHRGRHPSRQRAFLLTVLLALPWYALPGTASVWAASTVDSPANPSFDEYRNDPAVQAQLRYFLGPGRRSVERALARGTPYLSMIQRSLQREGLPPELAWLPLIESGFSSAAVSRAGATGMWQFMPGTARRYGLRVDRYIDERHDAVKSTRAAVRHLRDLTDRYGSPFLAAAAYNAGAGRVDRGLEHLDIDEAVDKDFFRLSKASLLAAETRAYVPKLIAAAMIAENPRKFGLRIEERSGDEVDSLVVNVAVRLSRVARDLGVSLSALRTLNPQFQSEITPAGCASVIRYPANPWRSPRMLREMQARWEAAAKYVDVASSHRVEARRPAGHRLRVLVRKGETLASIAASQGTTVPEICRANLLPGDYVLRAGQVLLVPGESDVATHNVEEGSASE